MCSQRLQEASKTPQDRSKTAPGRPGSAQERPSTAQEGSKRGLGAVQEGPKMVKNRVPRGIPSWTPPGPSKNQFWDSKKVDFGTSKWSVFGLQVGWFSGFNMVDFSVVLERLTHV